MTILNENEKGRNKNLLHLGQFPFFLSISLIDHKPVKIAPFLKEPFPFAVAVHLVNYITANNLKLKE